AGGETLLTLNSTLKLKFKSKPKSLPTSRPIKPRYTQQKQQYPPRTSHYRIPALAARFGSHHRAKHAVAHAAGFGQHSQNARCLGTVVDATVNHNGKSFIKIEVAQIAALDISDILAPGIDEFQVGPPLINPRACRHSAADWTLSVIHDGNIHAGPPRKNGPLLIDILTAATEKIVRWFKKT
ncbi:MAG: hypothetical protein RQ826_14145, partial [Xanthomonadales bacterium]|nr:hypothetical protein [Xanthomonadales bacterium]